MESKKFRKIIGNLLVAGLKFMPDDITTTVDKIWYPVLKDYEPDLLRQVIANVILTYREFPTISEVLYELTLKKYGIVSFRTYLHSKGKEKKRMLVEQKEKIANIQADGIDDLRAKKKEIYQDTSNVFPPEIRTIIDALGGDIDNILQYKMKEFKKLVKRKVKHKMLMEKRDKLLEEK